MYSVLSEPYASLFFLAFDRADGDVADVMGNVHLWLAYRKLWSLHEWSEMGSDEMEVLEVPGVDDPRF